MVKGSDRLMISAYQSVAEKLFAPGVGVSRGWYLSLLEKYQKLSHCTSKVIGCIDDKNFGELPILSVHMPPQGNSNARVTKVLMTAGIHGDEPAPVLALHEILKKVALKLKNIEIFAFACVNPAGLLRGWRGSSQDYDLNRLMEPSAKSTEVRILLSEIAKINTSFDVVFDLHEDNPQVACDFCDDGINATGFYLYESVRNRSSRSLGHHITETIRQIGLPIVSDNSVYGEKTERGVVFRDRSHCDRQDFERYMLMNWADRIFIPETPTTWELRDRVIAHEWAVQAGLCSMQHQCRR